MLLSPGKLDEANMKLKEFKCKSDLVLFLGKPDEVDIEWEDFKCEFEERNDQLANLEFGLDLVDAAYF